NGGCPSDFPTLERDARAESGRNGSPPFAGQRARHVLTLENLRGSRRSGDCACRSRRAAVVFCSEAATRHFLLAAICGEAYRDRWRREIRLRARWILDFAADVRWPGRRD